MRINSSSHIHALAYLCVFENSIYIYISNDDDALLLLLFRAREKKPSRTNESKARRGVEHFATTFHTQKGNSPVCLGPQNLKPY